LGGKEPEDGGTDVPEVEEKTGEVRWDVEEAAAIE